MTARHAGLPGTLGSFIGMISSNTVASLLTPFLCSQRSTIVPETVGQCKLKFRLTGHICLPFAIMHHIISPIFIMRHDVSRASRQASGHLFLKSGPE